nr:protein FAM169B isoform X4 [Columba livia]
MLRGCLDLVDTLAGHPEVLQIDAETYYGKLLKKSSSTPAGFSIPGGEEVHIKSEFERHLCCGAALYSASAVQFRGPEFEERVVLFVLNYIIFGTLEGSSADDAFLLPHSATECAKILWRNGKAIAYFLIKMKVNFPVYVAWVPTWSDYEESESGKYYESPCDRTTSQCYLLPALDTIFVGRKYGRGGLGMKMLHDFCQSFMAEDALGINCPISAAVYQGGLLKSVSHVVLEKTGAIPHHTSAIPHHSSAIPHHSEGRSLQWNKTWRQSPSLRGRVVV